MVFKFFKEMMSSIKEGIDEGKAELAEETQKAELFQVEQLRQVLGREMFLVSLGAPYRHFFIAEDTLSCGTFFIDQKKKSEAANLLRRDFGINDTNSARGAALTMQTLIYSSIVNAQIEMSEKNEDYDTGTKLEIAKSNMKIMEKLAEILEASERDTQSTGANPGVLLENQIARCVSVKAMVKPNMQEYVDALACALIAVNVARMSYCISVSASLGYLSHKEALELMEPIGDIVVTLMSGWDVYSQAYIAGEDSSKLNTVLGRKVLRDATKKLIEMTDGPWQTQPWPGSLADLVNQHG